MAEHWYGVAQTKEDCTWLLRWKKNRTLTIISCSLEARLFLQSVESPSVYVWDLFDMERLIDGAFFRAKDMTLEDARGDRLYKKAAVHRMHVEFLSHAVASKMLADKCVAYIAQRCGSVIIPKTAHIFLGAYFPHAQRKMQSNPLLFEFLAEASGHNGIKVVRGGSDAFFARIWAPLVYHRALMVRMLRDTGALIWSRLVRKRTIHDLLKFTQRADILTIGWGRDLHRMLSLCELHKKISVSHKSAAHIIWRPSKISEKDRSVGSSVLIRESIKKGVAYGPAVSMLDGRGGKRLLSFYRSAPYKKAFTSVYGTLSSSSVFRYNVLYNSFFSYRETFLTALLISEVIKKVRPQVVLGSDSGGESARAEMITAEAAGVKTVSTPHGYQAYAMESYNYLADVVLTYGDATARILEHCGVSAERIRAVGSAHERSEKMKVDAPIKVVIATRSWGGLWSNYSSTHPQLHKEFMSLLHKFKEDERYDVTIKSHPNGDLHGYYDLLVDHFACRRIRHVASGWRAHTFKQSCDILIGMGDCPSLFISALYFNKPIVFIDGLMSLTQKKMGYRYKGVAAVVEDGLQAYEACQRKIANDPEFVASFGADQDPEEAVCAVLVNL